MGQRAQAPSAWFRQSPTRDQFGAEGDRERVTIAVYDEGHGLFGLYVQPLTAATALEVCTSLGLREQMMPLTNPMQPPPDLDGSGCEFQSPKEWIHAPLEHAASHYGETLLAGAHSFLPAESSRRLGLSIAEEEHGVVYTRHPEVLAAFVNGVLAALAADRCVQLPQFTVESLHPLMQPCQPGEWHELSITPGQRITTIDAVLLSVGDAHDLQPQALHRLVVRNDGTWRAGWAW